MEGRGDEWRVGGGVLVIHLKTSLYRNNTCILLVKFVIVIECQFLAFDKRQYFMCLDVQLLLVYITSHPSSHTNE